MVDALSFLDAVAGYSRAQRDSSADRPIKLGTIDSTYDPWENYPDVPSLPKVKFDGEDTNTTKRYGYVQGFIPCPGQRVWLVPIGTTYMIAGAVENTGLQGFFAKPSDDYFTTEFGGGSYLEVDAGASSLIVDDVQLGPGKTSGPRGNIGGKQFTGGGNLATGIAGTEAVGNMDTGSVTMYSDRQYRIHLKIQLLGSVTNDIFIVRVRDTNLAGTWRGEFVWKNDSATYGWSPPVLGFSYRPSVSSESKTFVVTGQRLSGTGSLSFTANGFFYVEDMGGTLLS